MHCSTARPASHTPYLQRRKRFTIHSGSVTFTMTRSCGIATFSNRARAVWLISRASSAAASSWPRRAWFDPYQRALVLAEKLHAAEGASQRRLHVITSRQDMADDSRIG